MKLLVSDFDGTYFTNEESIIKNNLWIKKWRKSGNIFMLSSGRSFKSLKEMTKKYNIEYDYLSCCDGSILYDNKDKILLKYNLNNSILKEFLNLKTKTNVERIQYSYSDDYYAKRKKESLIGCNLVIKNNNITNIFLNQWNQLREKYLEYDFLAYKHDEITFFCLKNKGINKSSTISYLKEKLDLNYENIYVFGDNENDYAMLSYYQGYYIGEVEEKIRTVCINGFNQVYEFLEEINI